MTTKLSFNAYQPTAFGRTRMLAIATAVSIAIGAGLASTSRADVGSVYFDANGNAAAGDRPLFNGAFTGFDNVGLGRSVMPNLTTGEDNVAIGIEALYSNTDRQRQLRHRRQRAALEHDRRRQHRHRHRCAAVQHHRRRQQRHRL